MENIITNTKTMMENRRDGCDCANFDVRVGELCIYKNVEIATWMYLLEMSWVILV